MASTYTRIGTIRAGVDYQDLVALNLVVQMLEHPDRYYWISVEADEAGYLDDVVALHSDGSYVASQVKFSTDPASPEDGWTWEMLLKEKRGKQGPLPSFLAKWCQSWQQLRQLGPIREAALVSNRKASPELAVTLSPFGIVDFDKIPAPEIKAEITRQLGDEDVTRAFFAEFRFYVDRPNLEDLEEAIRRRFHALGGTDQGWFALKDEMRTWVRDRTQPPPDGKITLNIARRAAQWYPLQSLPQGFEVPADYVLPSQEFQDNLVTDLRGLQERCIVLAAPPGLGKSTYLSYLVQRLQEENILVVRHHYLLSVTDRSGDRLSHRRVAESLMSDLQNFFPEALGEEGTRNPNHNDLGRWLETCGKHFLSQGRTLLVVVDGLDHVFREKRSIEELSHLFEHLLPPPEGVVVLVGTQPVDEAQLPSRLLREAPRERWRSLPSLDRATVRQWLEHHTEEIGKTGHPHVREHLLGELADAFFASSKGHPLHLKYSLRALLEQGLPVTPSNVASLPGCPHQDIEGYYSELWRALPESGREILHLLASCPFAWPLQGIIDTLDPNARKTAAISEALRKIVHLAVRDQLGIRPFHNSLLVFVEGQLEHLTYKARMKQLALNWLCTSGPHYLRWAYEWRLQADLGDSQPLVSGPSRSWAIDAIVKRYSSEEVSEILARCCRAALEVDDLARYIEVGLLRDYLLDFVYDSRRPQFDKLLEAQLAIREDPSLAIRLQSNMTTLSPLELTTLARDAHSRDNQQLVGQIFDEIRSRLRAGNIAYRDEWDSLLDTFPRIAALCDDVVPQKVAEYGVRLRKEGRSILCLRAYSEELRRSKEAKKLRELLKFDFDELERSVVVRQAVLLALEEHLDLTAALGNGEITGPFEAIYLHLGSASNLSLAHLNFPSVDSLSAPEYTHYSLRPAIRDVFYRAFFCFLANHLYGHPERNEHWLMEVGGFSWPRQFLHLLNDMAGNLAKSLRRGTAPPLGWVFQEIQGFERPSWPEERDEYEYGIAAEHAINQIALDIQSLGVAFGKNPSISQSDLETALNSGYCHPFVWVEDYPARGCKWLTDNAVKWLLAQLEFKVGNAIGTFSERASDFALLANLAATHGFKDKARHYIREAASNLLGYGDHKDMLLFGALDVISACHSAGLSEARQWLLSLVPAIASVTDFTDGDETDYLPEYLSDVLAVVVPDLLPRYHEWLLQEEEYHDALHAFHVYLRTADLSSDITQALARTAIDDGSVRTLEERASAGDEEARSALSALSNYLGGIAHLLAEENDSTASPSPSFAEDDVLPDPPGYPPDCFDKFLRALEPSYRSRSGKQVSKWLQYWTSVERSEDALSAVEEALKQGEVFDVFDDLFDLTARLYGAKRAYPWLVRAHIDRYGWSTYFTDKDEAVRRWHIIKERLPDRWLTFVKDTISGRDQRWRGPSGSNRFRRIVEYCLLMNRNELAKQVAERVIAFTLETVSPLQLPIPNWIIEHDRATN